MHRLHPSTACGHPRPTTAIFSRSNLVWSLRSFCSASSLSLAFLWSFCSPSFSSVVRHSLVSLVNLSCFAPTFLPFWGVRLRYSARSSSVVGIVYGRVLLAKRKPRRYLLKTLDSAHDPTPASRPRLRRHASALPLGLHSPRVGVRAGPRESQLPFGRCQPLQENCAPLRPWHVHWHTHTHTHKSHTHTFTHNGTHTHTHTHHIVNIK